MTERLVEIVNIRLTSADGKLGDPTTISLVDGHISAFGCSKTRGPFSLDGSGLVAFPGLIDMHVHLCSSSLGPTDRAIDDIARINARTAIEAGITTVRDLGGDLATLADVHALALQTPWRAPEVVYAGPMITAPGSHGSRRYGAVVSSSAELYAEVDIIKAAGASWVKLVSGGAGIGPSLSRALLANGARYAARNKLRAAIHANFGQDNLSKAVNARPHTIEHGCDLSIIDLSVMRNQGTTLCPTLTIVHQVAGHPETYPPSSPLSVECSKAVNTNPSFVARALQAGVAITPGTDAGMTGCHFDSLINEFSLLLDAGMTWLGVLRSATVGAASVLGRSDIGRLSAGAWGNLILLDGNPYDTPGIFPRPHAVIHRGHLCQNQGASYSVES